MWTKVCGEKQIAIFLQIGVKRLNIDVDDIDKCTETVYVILLNRLDVIQKYLLLDIVA